MPLLSLRSLGDISKDGNLFLATASQNDADLHKVVAGVAAGNPPTRVVDALWVLAPDVKRYMHASYNVFRPDMAARWLTFVYFGRAEPAPTVSTSPQQLLRRLGTWHAIANCRHGVESSRQAQPAACCQAGTIGGFGRGELIIPFSKS